MALTDREIDILAFERSWWATGCAKETAIREQFDLSSAEYYRLLGELLDRPEALTHDPLLIRRLRRQRITRQRERSARRARD
ncbi:DUF3263 domain-containing protein [Nocardioides sp.]|jgi:hypothetical protein|uniref:DUF3263 domain-containing protein n=1 Tax=Nocardioides sp. TaxID=35761 RepID=UPI002BB94BC4|nr:DUF3263 domain-containing protein [Nocardioides sp.]HVX54059.1 DUF3263 domain-containing protein [Nocardioides sp.]